MTGVSTANSPAERTAAPSAVEVRDLVSGYDGVEVLHGVSLAVEAGALLGLVGPNGSGKTTLLRCIAGVLPAREGTVSILGERLEHLSPRALARRVAVVPQSMDTTFAFTIEELVAMGRHPHLGRLQPQSARDRDAIEEALVETGLTGLRNRSITEVSGGERQMAVVARALAQQASVLLLDEPTSQLDLAHQRDVMGLLVRLNRQRGTTMIMVSHDLNLAAAYSDTLAMLVEGRLQCLGRPADVLTAETVVAAYKVEAHVAPHPITGQPYLYVLPAAEGRGESAS